MDGTKIPLNIAGNPKDISQEDRNRRAINGVNIVLRSGHHRKKIDKVSDKATRDYVEAVIREKIGSEGSQEDFEKLEGNFNALRKDTSAKQGDVNLVDAEEVFKAIKKEANIVASSSDGMLRVGKQTSKISKAISKIPLGIGAGIMSAVNGAMRAVLGNRMGDDDIKHSKVEGAVFDVQESSSSAPPPPPAGTGQGAVMLVQKSQRVKRLMEARLMLRSLIEHRAKNEILSLKIMFRSRLRCSRNNRI